MADDIDPTDTTDPAETIDPTETEPPEWTPPTREEWEAAQAKAAADLDALTQRLAATEAKVTAANKQAADRRGELNRLKQQYETDAEKAAREATEQAETAAKARLKPALIPVAAKAALLEAEALPHRAAALARLVNVEVIDVEGTDVTGLDAEVLRLKEEYPEFFRQPETEKPEPPKPKPAAAEVGSRKPQPVVLSPLEQLAAQLDGRTK
jgi:hypothetical protein